MGGGVSKEEPAVPWVPPDDQIPPEPYPPGPSLRKTFRNWFIFCAVGACAVLGAKAAGQIPGRSWWHLVSTSLFLCVVLPLIQVFAWSPYGRRGRDHERCRRAHDERAHREWRNLPW